MWCRLLFPVANRGMTVRMVRTRPSLRPGLCCVIVQSNVRRNCLPLGRHFPAPMRDTRQLNVCLAFMFFLFHCVAHFCTACARPEIARPLSRWCPSDDVPSLDEAVLSVSCRCSVTQASLLEFVSLFDCELSAFALSGDHGYVAKLSTV